MSVMFADLRRRSTCWFSQISCGNLLKTDKIINNIMDNVAGIFQSRFSHFQLLRLRANICWGQRECYRCFILLLLPWVVRTCERYICIWNVLQHPVNYRSIRRSSKEASNSCVQYLMHLLQRILSPLSLALSLSVFLSLVEQVIRHKQWHMLWQQ